MSISEQEVRHIARLARLSITDDEVNLYREQLNKILESMADLGSVDTSGVPPMSGVLGVAQALRKDQASSFAEAQSLIAAAPESAGGFIKVRRVIE